MDRKILKILKTALKEDRAKADVTTLALLPASLTAKAAIIFKEPGVICGLDIVRQVFKLMDRQIRFKVRFRDGERVRAGTVVARVEGRARAILGAERTAMNFLGHLSGVATLTGKYVAKIKGLKAKVMDTRKTLPNLRLLQKYAVACGGGANHRLDLAQMILIKDNHKKILRRRLKIEEVIKQAKQRAKGKRVEIEVENLREFREALVSHPDIIMLDNMKLAGIKAAVRLKHGSPEFRDVFIEASGSVGLGNIRPIAKAGPDMISIGSLTHSAPAIDVSLEIVR